MGLTLNSDLWLYFVALLVAALMYLIAWNLLRGRIGRALIAIRDQPTAAALMGIDTSLYKSLAFGVSALFTGVAGSLSAILVAFVAPDSFTVFLSITLMVGMVVGGLTSLPGALYGAAFCASHPQSCRSDSQRPPLGPFMVHC
jgi:branched-chain amino acid transport system permease protein